MHRINFFRRVFLAAALYNLIVGSVYVMLPNIVFTSAGLPPLDYPFLFSGIGMMVAVYGYGYWVVSRDPLRYPQLVFIGILGKGLGALGWSANVIQGAVPAATLWMTLFNDVIWLPLFIAYLLWWRGQRLTVSDEQA